MDPLLLRKIDLLNQKTLKLLDDISEITYPQPGIEYPWNEMNPDLKIGLNSFENLLLKFNRFYAFNYLNIELPYEDYELFKSIPDFIASVPEARFLIQISNCISREMLNGYDPADCLDQKRWFDPFIVILKIHTLMIKNLLPPNSFQFRYQLEQFLMSLNEFTGEWRNNPLENVFFGVIPPEYPWYDYGERD